MLEARSTRVLTSVPPWAPGSMNRRDFGDVTPMRGVLLGVGRHQLRVGVDVTPTGN